METLEREMPKGLIRLMEIQGLGARRVKALYEKLNIRSIDDLKRAAQKNRIRELPGFGAKIEESIRKEIERVKSVEGFWRISSVEEIGTPLLEYLRKAKGVKRCVIAGSFRRAKETVRDLDILASCEDGASIMEHFIKYEDAAKVVSHGETRSTVILRPSGLQVDLRVVPEESYGAALCYLTGSKAHNIALRKLAIKKGLKLNEYGVFKAGPKGREKRIAGHEEEEVYRTLGLAYELPGIG